VAVLRKPKLPGRNEEARAAGFGTNKPAACRALGEGGESRR